MSKKYNIFIRSQAEAVRGRRAVVMGSGPEKGAGRLGGKKNEDAGYGWGGDDSRLTPSPCRGSDCAHATTS